MAKPISRRYDERLPGEPPGGELPAVANTRIAPLDSPSSCLRAEEVEALEVQRRSTLWSIFLFPATLQELDTVLIVENLPRVDESKQAKLQGFVTKVFSALGKIVDDGVYMPVNKETGTTEGCVLGSGTPPNCCA
jgi:hypothetical protein